MKYRFIAHQFDTETYMRCIYTLPVHSSSKTTEINIHVAVNSFYMIKNRLDL